MDTVTGGAVAPTGIDTATIGTAAPRRTDLDDLYRSLRAAPWSHDFHALLRRLDALHATAPRFGRALRAAHEPIRLGQDAELDFAPAALSSFVHDPGAAAPRLGVRFFGLLGSQGPMPLHLTEYVRERQRFRNDPTAGRFLDVFHHRLLALFYRAWADAQPTVQHDRPADDRYSVWLGSAAGLGEPSTGGPAEGLPRSGQLHQAGLLATRSRHPEGLAKLLAQSFGVPVRVESHVLQWLPIEHDDRSRLGVTSTRSLEATPPMRSIRGAAEGRTAVRDTGAAVQGQGVARDLGATPHGRTAARAGQQAVVLGRTAIAGHKVRDRQSTCRIVLGPLSLAAYQAFLPDGEAWPALRDWIRQYAGFDLRWELSLSLAAAEVHGTRLGRRARLGVSAWTGASIPSRETAAPFRSTSSEAAASGFVRATAAPPGALRPRDADRCDLRLRPATSFPLRRRQGAYDA